MPSPFRKDQLDPAMRARYGMDRRPFGQVVGIVAVALAFAAGLVFVGVNLGQGNVDARVMHWTAESDHALVHIEISRPDGAATTCALRGQDRTYADVGYYVFEVPAGQERVRIDVALRTLMEPYAVELLGCAVDGELHVQPPQFPTGVVPPRQPWSPS